MSMQPLISGARVSALQRQKPEAAQFSQTENLPEAEEVVNLQAEIQNASDELADMLSAFGRFARNARKIETTETDPLASLLDEGKEEKLDLLVKFIGKLRLNDTGLLNYARSLFPHDSDLMMALKEMLLYRRLSDLQKKKIQQAINELKQYADQSAMQSGINVAHTARRFAAHQGSEMTAELLRASYLRFLASRMPAGYLYDDWIKQYGIERRHRVLAFMLQGLAADMRSIEPGLNAEEFGPLFTALTNARMINTLDESLIEIFTGLTFLTSRQDPSTVPGETEIVGLFIKGLNESDNFLSELDTFSKIYLLDLLVKQRIRVLQEIYNIYFQAPEEIFADYRLKNIMLENLIDTLTVLFEKERSSGLWKDYYRKS